MRPPRSSTRSTSWPCGPDRGGGAHHHRPGDRPPAVHRHQRRPDPGHGGRPGARRRHPRGAASPTTTSTASSPPPSSSPPRPEPLGSSAQARNCQTVVLALIAPCSRDAQFLSSRANLPIQELLWSTLASASSPGPRGGRLLLNRDDGNAAGPWNRSRALPRRRGRAPTSARARLGSWPSRVRRAAERLKRVKHKLATTLLVVAALVVATLTSSRPPPAQRGGRRRAVRLAHRHLRASPASATTSILKWDEQLLSTIRAYPAQTGPTITARALGILHTAIYDAWAAYDPTAMPAPARLHLGPRSKRSGNTAGQQEQGDQLRRLPGAQRPVPSPYADPPQCRLPTPGMSTTPTALNLGYGHHRPRHGIGTAATQAGHRVPRQRRRPTTRHTGRLQPARRLRRQHRLPRRSTPGIA